MYVQIAHTIQVEEDIEIYKKVMISDIEQFTIEMQQFDFSVRTNSFIGADSKEYNKFISANGPAKYDKLVKLNLKLKEEMAKMRRVFSFKYEMIKEAVIASEILRQKSLILSSS